MPADAAAHSLSSIWLYSAMLNVLVSMSMLYCPLVKRTRRSSSSDSLTSKKRTCVQVGGEQGGWGSRQCQLQGSRQAVPWAQQPFSLGPGQLGFTCTYTNSK